MIENDDKRRVPAPGGASPRGQLLLRVEGSHSREFLQRAGRVLSRRNKRLLSAADFMTRENVDADMRLLNRRGLLEMVLLDAAWEGPVLRSLGGEGGAR